MLDYKLKGLFSFAFQIYIPLYFVNLHKHSIKLYGPTQHQFFPLFSNCFMILVETNLRTLILSNARTRTAFQYIQCKTPLHSTEYTIFLWRKNLTKLPSMCELISLSATFIDIHLYVSLPSCFILIARTLYVLTN